MCDNNLANTVSINDIVKAIQQRKDNTMDEEFFKYKAAAKDVFRLLNLSTIKQTKRFLVEVEQHTNSITLPEESILLSSVSAYDECGHIKQLMFNKEITRDIVDLSMDKSCYCECGCNSTICSGVKNYEAVTKTVYAPLPSGTSVPFEVVSRKKVLPDGSFVTEYTEPVAIYENGVWTTTRLETKTEHLCNVEISSCGCPKDNDLNRKKIRDCCGENFFTDECGRTCGIGEPVRSFGLSESGNKILLPSDIYTDHLLVRVYTELSGKDIRIPLIAKKAMMWGTQSEIADWSEDLPEVKVARYKDRFQAARRELRNNLTKFNLQEFYANLFPERRML